MVVSSLGYFRVDEMGFIRAWDENMTLHLGYTTEETLGRSMGKIVPKSYRDRHWKGFRSAMSNGATKHNQPALNVPFVCKDGVIRSFPAREIFLRDAFKNPVGVLAIIGPACSLSEKNGLPSPYADDV